MPVVMRIDYLLRHNYAHSIKLFCIMPARCLRVRNYYCHFVSVLQKPCVSEMSDLQALHWKRMIFPFMCMRFCALNSSSLWAVISRYQWHHYSTSYRKVLYMHLCFISIIKRSHYVIKLSIWVKMKLKQLLRMEP